MQLTPATDVTAAPPGAGGRLARLNRPSAAGLIALAGWAAFAAARLAGWAHGQLSLFIQSGTYYSHPALMLPRIHHVRGKGYDGQFYYRFAFNPVNWHATGYGITIDHPYRYTRIGYSVVAWLLSGGGHGRLLPVMLVLVNLAGVAAVGWLGAVFARGAGRHALWGLLFAAYFGLVVSVGRDTSEPLADACLLGGLLAYRRSRYPLAAALVSYAVFTNEPVLVLPVALAVTRLWQACRRWFLGRRRFLGQGRVWFPGRGRVAPGLPDLVWAAPGLLYLLLQGVQRLVVGGQAGGVADAAANLTWPLRALVPGLERDVDRMSLTHLGTYDYNLIEFAALAVFIVAACAVLRSTAAPAHERLAFAGFVLLELVIASSQFWYSIFGDGRTFIDAYLMALVLLVAAPGRVVSSRRLGALAAVAFAALVVVARRRILFQ